MQPELLVTPVRYPSQRRQPIQLPPTDDPFPYGWRNVKSKHPNGTVTWTKIPLTPDDFLNPQLGDYMPQDHSHARLAVDIQTKLEKYLSDRAMILFDTKLLWGIPGLAEPFPDITVIPAKIDWDTRDSCFDCVKHGVRPCLIIEIMSPQYAGDDTKKVKIYERAGVQEYIIINPHFKKQAKALELIGYRLTGHSYQRIPLDSQHHLLSKTTGVKFTVDTLTKRELILLDGQTNQPLLTNLEEQAARTQAELRAQAAELELAQLRAELAQLRQT